MSLRKIKDFVGSLNLKSIKRGFDYAKKGLNLINDIENLGNKHDVELIKNITGKLKGNKVFQNVEKGINIGNTLINGYETSKNSGLFNKVDNNINKIGIDHSLNRYNENNMLDETNIADRIVSGMRYKRSLSA